MAKRQYCDACAHWSAPAPTQSVENVGVCSALAKTVGPFWAKNMLYLTASYDGENCARFKGEEREVSGRAL
jgi:hypothetical protein